MDVHRVVIGEQYYLQLSVGWYPIQCIMNEQMIWSISIYYSLLKEKISYFAYINQMRKTY